MIRFFLNISALLLCVTTHAIAQDAPEPLPADQLFSEGVRLMKADHCQDALPLFMESQRIDPAAVTLTNIATCYVRLGKTASAYRTYQQASRAAILENKPELQRRTDHAIQTLSPSLTRLKIVPLGSTPLPEIRVNGQLVEDVREPIPLDPGENFIEATAKDRNPWRRTVRALGEGTVLMIEVPELPAAPASSTVTTTPETKSSPTKLPTTHKSLDLRPYAIIGAGVGIASLAAGSILALSANSKQNNAERYCDGRYCTQTGLDLRDSASTRADLATWTVGFGLVALTTATILYVTSPSTHTERPAGKLALLPQVEVGQKSALFTLTGEL
jgi:hypothetical protein